MVSHSIRRTKPRCPQCPSRCPGRASASRAAPSGLSSARRRGSEWRDDRGKRRSPTGKTGLLKWRCSIGVAPNHPFWCSDFPWLGYLIVRKPTARCFILKIFKGMIIFLATRKVGQTHDRFPCWTCSYCSHGLLPSKRLDLNYVRTFFVTSPQV